jgi:phage-related protein
MGSSLDDLREFPLEARRAIGFELDAVQRGLEPSDWKAMNTVGSGAYEIRVHRAVNGALFMLRNIVTLFTYCMLFKRKPKKPAKKISIWLAAGINNWETNDERKNYRLIGQCI